MGIIGKLYEPFDNSFCINCRNGKKALLVRKNVEDLYYIGPNSDEVNANFKIVSEPYEEDIYETFDWIPRTYTFINIKSLKTENIYRTLFLERNVL